MATSDTIVQLGASDKATVKHLGGVLYTTVIFTMQLLSAKYLLMLLAIMVLAREEYYNCRTEN